MVMEYEEKYQNVKSKTGEVIRVRLPQGRQVIGIVETRLGANKMLVRCFDGNSRVCRVPGKYNKRLWIRPNDVVLVEPWEFQSDKKGDIIYKYSHAAVEWLKQNGYIKVEF